MMTIALRLTLCTALITQPLLSAPLPEQWYRERSAAPAASVTPQGPMKRRETPTNNTLSYSTGGTLLTTLRWQSPPFFQLCDLNGDGTDDLVFGCDPFNTQIAQPNLSLNQNICVVFGGPKAWPVDLSQLDGTNGFYISATNIIRSACANLRGGVFHDLLLVDNGATIKGMPGAGQVSVVYGAASFPAFPPRIPIINGGTRGAAMQAITVLDFHQTGSPVIALGCVRELNNAGRVYLVNVPPEGFVTPVNLGNMTAAQGVAIDGVGNSGGYGFTGYELRGGDVDGDGHPELFIESGLTKTHYVLKGGRNETAYNLTTLALPQGFKIIADQIYGLDLGDVTGDNITDIVMAFNNDGKPATDLAIIYGTPTIGQNPFQIPYLGSGNGTYLAFNTTLGINNQYNLELMDANGDGIKDMLLSLHGQQLTIFGNPNFSVPLDLAKTPDGSAAITTSGYFYRTATGNFLGNGTDIVTLSSLPPDSKIEIKAFPTTSFIPQLPKYVPPTTSTTTSTTTTDEPTTTTTSSTTTTTTHEPTTTTTSSTTTSTTDAPTTTTTPTTTSSTSTTTTHEPTTTTHEPTMTTTPTTTSSTTTSTTDAPTTTTTPTTTTSSTSTTTTRKPTTKPVTTLASPSTTTTTATSTTTTTHEPTTTTTPATSTTTPGASTAASTGLIAGVAAAVGTVVVAGLAYLTWACVRQSRLKPAARNGVLMAMKKLQGDGTIPETKNPIYEQAHAVYENLPPVAESVVDEESYVQAVGHNPNYEPSSHFVYLTPDQNPADYAVPTVYPQLDAYEEPTGMGASSLSRYLTPVRQVAQAVYETATDALTPTVTQSSKSSPDSSETSATVWSSDYDTGPQGDHDLPGGFSETNHPWNTDDYAITVQQALYEAIK